MSSCRLCPSPREKTAEGLKPQGIRCIIGLDLFQEDPTLKKKKSAVLSLSGPHWDVVMVTLFSVLLFFAMNLWSEPAAVGFAFIALVLVIGRTPWRLARERFCVPVIGFMGFMLMTGLAAIYSPFGGSAVRDFRGILPAFALAVLVLLRFEKRHVRGLLWGIAAVCAVVSLLSTDMACEGKLYEVFVSLMGQFDMGEVYTDLENTVGRVNGLYNDANVTGSLFAIASLIGLYLAQTGEKWWDRLLACVLISVNAVGLLLSVSRGAILCFGLSLLVWLIAAGKEHRIRLFLLMVVSAGTCLAAFMPASEAIAPGRVLPNFLSIGAGAVIFLLDWGIAERLARKLAGHGKAVAAVMGGFVILGGIYIFVALTVTEPHYFQEGIALSRSMNLQPGEYTLSVDGDLGGSEEVYIYKRSQAEVLLGKRTELYSGPLNEVSFTVPEDSASVFFYFYGADGTVLREAILSNGFRIPMDYKLLPNVIVSRLQGGLFSDNSYLLRIQFMKDGWEIYKQSVLVGHGLGSSDNLYPAVQPFYYASRYVHNHLLQTMTDMGLIGLLFFLTLLGGVLGLLLCAFRSDQSVLPSALLACWVIINTHSLMEINFSIQSYQCVAFLILLFPVILYSKPLPERVKRGNSFLVCTFFGAYIIIFGGLLGLRQSVQQESASLRAGSVDEVMSALESYARRDVFDPDPYRLEYVATAVQYQGGAYEQKMLEYVDDLRYSGNYPAVSGLLEYYYLKNGDIQELFACSKECLAQRASYTKIWNGQVEFYRTDVLTMAGKEKIDEFTDGILSFQVFLEEVNNQETRIEKIVLTDENQAFLDAVRIAKAEDLSADTLYQRLNTYKIP